MKALQKYWRLIFPLIFLALIIASKQHQIILFIGLGYSCSSFLKGLNPGIYPQKQQLGLAAGACLITAVALELYAISQSGAYADLYRCTIYSLAGLVGVLSYIAIFCFYRRIRFRRVLKKIGHPAEQ